MDSKHSMPFGRRGAGPSLSRLDGCETRTLTSPPSSSARPMSLLDPLGSCCPRPQLLTSQLPLLPCSRRRRRGHPRLAVAPVPPARVLPPAHDLDQALVLRAAPGVEGHAVLAQQLLAYVVPPDLAERSHRRGVPPALGHEVAAEAEAVGPVPQLEPSH